LMSRHGGGCDIYKFFFCLWGKGEQMKLDRRQ
jgi:hypothetical protein